MIDRLYCTTTSASATSRSAKSTMPRNSYSTQLRLDDNLQAAHYNMVMLYLQRAMQAQPIPKAAFVHAARAIQIGPGTADLYHVVAALYAMAAKQDPSLIQPAIEYVGKAIELGCDPNTFTSDIISYSALQEEPAFRNAIKKPASPAKSPPATRLVDPLDMR